VNRRSTCSRSSATSTGDVTPLVRSCGGETSPGSSLKLAPWIGATFDPATVGDRALALLDVEHGTLA
jgi:hypothetical protein